jgi:hypothetical protein
MLWLMAKEKIEDLEGSANKFFYDSKNKEKDRFNDLANVYLKLGNYQKFCEVQIRLGKWEKALAFAPAVSYEYWNSLVQQYASVCQETDAEESSYLSLISNNGLQVQHIKQEIKHKKY